MSPYDVMKHELKSYNKNCIRKVIFIRGDQMYVVGLSQVSLPEV